jgi:hypothetical protein
MCRSKIILKWIYVQVENNIKMDLKLNWRPWSGYIWLRIGTGGRVLLVR